EPGVDEAVETETEGPDEDPAGTARRRENAERLLEWLRGGQGMRLMKAAGYIPVYRSTEP
ncbi:MAG: hypothetical protein II627_05995, partial [Lachnospiraceae bacterium]|nr:hypothetical protein [Lachnospiraceae bacterium]